MSANNIELNERNTFSNIIKEMRKHLSSNDFGSLNMFHRTFMMTVSFLPEILIRIIEHVKKETRY